MLVIGPLTVARGARSATFWPPWLKPLLTQLRNSNHSFWKRTARGCHYLCSKCWSFRDLLRFRLLGHFRGSRFTKAHWASKLSKDRLF